MNRWVLRDRLRTKIVVTLKTGDTFIGVLWEADREALVLRNAEQVQGASKATVAVDGEVVVLRDNVAFVQRP